MLQQVNGNATHHLPVQHVLLCEGVVVSTPKSSNCSSSKMVGWMVCVDMWCLRLVTHSKHNLGVGVIVMK